MLNCNGEGNLMTGISLEQLNLYSQLSGAFDIPTSIPSSKPPPVSFCRICKISTTGCSKEPNCRFGLLYCGLTLLCASKLPSTHITSVNGPRSTITRRSDIMDFHLSATAAAESIPNLSLLLPPPV